MPQHLPKPSQLATDYQDMLDELATLIAPYLPEHVRLRAIERARDFGADLDDYAEIDAVIRALRNSGLPEDYGHRSIQLMKDHIKTRQARRSRLGAT